jgi:hypothetical protein
MQKSLLGTGLFYNPLTNLLSGNLDLLSVENLDAVNISVSNSFSTNEIQAFSGTEIAVNDRLTVNNVIKGTSLILTDVTDQIEIGTGPNTTLLDFPIPSGPIRLTFPSEDATIATTDTAQTFTNHTYSNPILTGIIVTPLTPSQAVVTDSSSNLSTLQYTDGVVVSTLVARDSGGSSSHNQLNISSLNNRLSGDLTIKTSVSGNIILNPVGGIQIVSQPATRVLALDGSKFLTNLPYDQLNTPGSLVQRDVSGTISCTAVTNDAADLTIQTTTSGDIILSPFSFIKVPTLNTTEVLATDASSNLTTIPYSSSSVINNLVQRDGSGDSSHNQLNAVIINANSSSLTLQTTISGDLILSPTTRIVNCSISTLENVPEVNNNSGNMLIRTINAGSITINSADSTVRLQEAGTTQFQVSSTGAQASNTTDASSSSTGGLTTLGGLGIAKKLYVGTGIFLPTTGGTPAQFDYFGNSESDTGTWSGPTGNFSYSVKYTRQGNVCTAVFSAFSGTGSASANFTSNTIPARFRPSNGFTQRYTRVTDNGTSLCGIIVYDSSNTRWLISTNSAQTNFSGTGSTGFSDCDFTYKV